MTDAVSKLAQDAKDAYAIYYAKVLQKLALNENHVEKELKRLQNILTKGGLVSEKVDELTTKVNILLQFFKEHDPVEEAPVEEAPSKDEL